MKACLILAVCLLSPICGLADELDLRAMFQEGIPPSPFSGVFYRYADTMLEHGRDTYGPKQTGMLLSALDRKTLKPLTTRPPAPEGVAEGLRPGRRDRALCGANPQLDQNTLRLLYFLVGLSGEARYGQAADAALRGLFDNADDDGRLPWGTVACRDATADERIGDGQASPDAFVGPWMLWGKCFELAPEPSKRFALGLRGKADSAASRPRQAGFCIRTWAEAYAHTDDAAFLEAIDARLAQHPLNRPAVTRADHILSWAIDCDGAARKVPPRLRSRLAELAAGGDRMFCSLPHEIKGGGGGFAMGSNQPRDFTTSAWQASHQCPTTAAVAMMCVSRYENTGKVAYRDLITAAADAYLDSLPDEETDAWPATFGHAISLELAAFRITSRPRYHQRALKLGEIAVERFFGESPLPRASLKSEHYESTTGAGTLVLALVDLHLTTLTITAVRAPANTLDR